jgi:plastocyanin
MKRPIFIVALFALAMVLVACGGGNATSQPESVSLTFVGTDDFKYDPATATVPSGAQVEVTLDNQGTLEHSWELVPEDADPATVTLSDAIDGIGTGPVPAGESQTITFTAPAPGTYKYMCTIPGHAAAGMVGTLTVE